MAPPLTQLEIENYGCIKDLTLALTPLHALIGPNDSGKSTILRALRTLMQFGGGTFQDPNGPNIRPFPPRVHPGQQPPGRIDGYYGDGLGYGLATLETDIEERLIEAGRSFQRGGRGSWNMRGALGRPGSAIVDQLATRVRPARMVRLNPDAMRVPTGLIPTTNPLELEETGFGIGSVYDALVSRDLDGFLTLRTEFLRHFESVAKLGWVNVTVASGAVAKTLQIELRDGSVVPAEAMSEGLLYYLGYAAQPYLAPTTLLLVEEPENGLHPARVADVVHILREVSKTTQVVLATHSPLVINELEGSEVSVITRDDAGTHARLLSETYNYAERSRIYANGELWLSHADGRDEHDLLQAPAKVS